VSITHTLLSLLLPLVEVSFLQAEKRNRNVLIRMIKNCPFLNIERISQALRLLDLLTKAMLIQVRDKNVVMKKTNMALIMTMHLLKLSKKNKMNLRLDQKSVTNRNQVRL
jgi:hypothetical protein